MTKMTYWKLFLDDERFPADDSADWRIARNVDDAIYYVTTYGSPAYMSLDHDLGYKRQTGKDFVIWLVSYCQSQALSIPDFYVHSQNPIGAENMRSYLEQAINFI